MLIDLDPGQPVYRLGHLTALLQRAGYRLRWLQQERSRSGRGWHLTCSVTPLPSSPMEVVALQAILGSDRYREACNVLRARMLPRVPPWGRAWFNVFYEAED